MLLAYVNMMLHDVTDDVTDWELVRAVLKMH
jgi:hypothetical protein